MQKENIFIVKINKNIETKDKTKSNPISFAIQIRSVRHKCVFPV